MRFYSTVEDNPFLNSYKKNENDAKNINEGQYTDKVLILINFFH